MKELLLKYCPFIFNLIERDKKVWIRVDKFRIRFENLISNRNPNQDIPIHCIYDWIALAELGNKQAVGFLKFLDNTTKKCINQVNERFHHAIKGIASEIVKAFDTDLFLNNNPTYLNYIGELVGLQAITNPEHQKFDLIEREYRLPNNLRADFYFLDLENRQPILVDFVSIHNIKKDHINSSNDLRSILIDRFNKKLESKTINLIENNNKIVFEDRQEIRFAILPIVWNELADFNLYSEVYSDLDKKFINILPCCSLVSLVKENGDYEYEFRSLSSIYGFLPIPKK